MSKIHNFHELQQAILGNDKELVIQCYIFCYHSIVLPENAILCGETGKIAMLCFNNGDGIGLSASNTIKDISIQTQPNHNAVYLCFAKNVLGSFVFENLTITGQFTLIAKAGVLLADLKLNNIDIVSADARNNFEQPQKYGVNTLQGALTIYNFNSNPESKLTISDENITIGRKNTPVIGSGIFIAGWGDNGGRTIVSRLHTGAVYSTGMLPLSVTDMITEGIFIVNGVKAKEVVHDGEIVTYIVNDRVLDTWGEVDSWTCNAPVISYRPSGVGFVNFGMVKKFTANAPLAKHGLGARGYNQYDGTIEEIFFHSITTYGDGSVGVQISKAIGKLTVLGGITTFGSIGNSLVKGVNVPLSAVALSIKPGGEAQQINIQGNIITHGNHVISYEVNSGTVHDILLDGEIITNGKQSVPVSIENNGVSPIAHLRIK